MARVFVYGTLKRDYHNSRLMATAKFIGKAYTVDTFRMFSVGFPVIRPNDNGHSVSGELYDVDPETLDRLDALEAEGRMYDRRSVPVVIVDGPGKDIIEDKTYIYVGNEHYWGDRNIAPYTHTNEHGELDWCPA